jgi:Raf kinase inhibitor-like YbhB/YbcL family protein
MRTVLIISLAALLSGCPKNQPDPASPDTSSPGRSAPATLTLASTLITEGQPIDRRHTCDGADLSPPLSWTTPPRTASLVLIVDDPDAPSGTFTHWLLYGLRPDRSSLPEGVDKASEVKDLGRQGKNDFGKLGYGGPCPPPGTPHRYRFKLFALSADPQLAAEADKEAVEKALAGKILAHATLTATYRRAPK